MDKTPVMVNETKAAEILRVKKSTLIRYRKNGLLQAMRFGGQNHYYVQHLLDLRDARQTDRFSGMGVHDKVDILSKRVEHLERRLRVLSDSLGLVHLYFELSDNQLTTLYEVALKCQGSLCKQKPPRIFIDRWLAVIPLMTEQEFRRLSVLYRVDADPWKCFYLLTEELLQAIRVQFDMDEEPNTEITRARMALCLERLKMAALEYIKLADPRVKDPRKVMMEKLTGPIPVDPTLVLEQMIQELSPVSLHPDTAVDELREITQLGSTPQTRSRGRPRNRRR